MDASYPTILPTKRSGPYYSEIDPVWRTMIELKVENGVDSLEYNLIKATFEKMLALWLKQDSYNYWGEEEEVWYRKQIKKRNGLNRSGMGIGSGQAG